MKIASVISTLPLYTQIAVLYPLLGSMNSSAINAAQRLVAEDLRDLNNASRQTTNIISIDKYNELLNEMRVKQLDADWRDENAPESTPDNTDDFLSTIMKVREPLLGIFNEAQDKMPNRNGGVQADFSFEESLARQIAREFSVAEAAAAAEEQALLDSGAVTQEELDSVDRERYQQDIDFKNEFKFLILDKLRDKAPLDSSTDEADAAFDQLGEDYQSRLLNRMLPKLQEAKRQNLGRRSFDPDANTNVLIIAKAIEMIKEVVGASDAEAKLAKLEALAA